MDFRTWLITNFIDEQAPIGDLARDVQSDHEWPANAPDSLEVYRDHLENMGAIDDALDTLDTAWAAYEEQRR